MRSVLVVDDDPEFRKLAGRLLAASGLTVVGEADSVAAALDVVDDLAGPLAEYGPYHAVRADLLRRAGRPAEAAAEYGLAADRAGNASERAFLLARRDALLA